MALTHGVTVALQILVLPVKVRILVGQQKKPLHLEEVFFIYSLSRLSSSRKLYKVSRCFIEPDVKVVLFT